MPRMRLLNCFTASIKLTLLILVCAFAIEAKEIRVGITEYQNVESAYEKYQIFFAELERIAQKERSADKDTTFSFAIGTYAEVIDWYNKKLIDVAILSAMPIADLLTTSNDDEVNRIRDSYLASLNPVGGSTAKCGGDSCQRSLDEQSTQCVTAQDQPPEPKTEYRVSCVVPAEYGWKTFEDVSKYAGQKKLKFLFVRPVSISGYIVPFYYLKTQAIDLKQEEFDFTYQHQESLQRLLERNKTDPDKYVVAFVIENTSYCVPKADSNKQNFTKLDTPGLSSIQIPHEAIVVNYNLEEEQITEIKKTLGRLLSRKFDDDKKEKNKTFTLTLRDSNKADWLRAYDKSKEIYESVRGSRNLQYGSSFDDFINSLKTYQKSTGKRPRLALVLSGGGAKCAYQAGAVSQIEDRLQQLLPDPKYGKIDFDLVVGTSGGAINALLVALGGTQDSRTQKAIREMWTSFHQQEFFTPSRIFNLIFGLCFGLLQALGITFAVLLFGREHLRWKRIGQLLVGLEVVEICLAVYLDAVSSSFALFVIAQVIIVVAVAALIRLVRRVAIIFLTTRPGLFWSKLYKQKVSDWWRLAGWLMLTVSTIEYIVARWQGPSSWWPTALQSHTMSHIWLVLVLMCSVSYPWPMVLGLLMALSGMAGRLEIDWHGRRHWLIRGLTLLVLILAGILILDALWKERSPSDSAQIEKAFIFRVPEMLAVLHPGFAAAAGADQKEQLRDISRRILNEPSLLKRDLVITVSNLPLAESLEEADNPQIVNANELPEDLYFFGKSPQIKSGLPPNEKRFINFQDNPDKLLDVVIGSGTIYPLFPYRDLTYINISKGKTAPLIKVIDGGFIHNSPIEAAIKWGATHIISIEASPLPKPFNPMNTLDNSLVAFKYIMAQTQRMDVVARGQVEIFELRPRSECEKKNLETGCNKNPEPNMDTFDFDRNITDGAFRIGQEDAKSLRPLFRRVPGPPLFRQTRQPVPSVVLTP
jgi:predicted acylesterase/phospholipase RssA/ABC-type phosphate/phosphonate transport system substrate-binding protein